MGLHERSDTSNETMFKDGLYKDLPFTDEQLISLCERYSLPCLEHVPRLKYWECDDGRRMSSSLNFCGHQQRAFDLYWSLRMFWEHGHSLSIGSGGVGAPGCLHTDKYCGVTPENDGGRYGDDYAFSMMTLDADGPWPFHNKQFGGVMLDHSYEHLANQDSALSEAVRVTKTDGYVCIIMPDMTFSKRGTIDKTHTTEWCADGFFRYVSARCEGLNAEVIEHNTFDNDFSFNTVLLVH